MFNAKYEACIYENVINDNTCFIIRYACTLHTRYLFQVAVDEQTPDHGQLATLFKFQNISLASVARYEGNHEVLGLHAYFKPTVIC